MKYFDYAATCPLDEEAALTYVKSATEYYGNSQSLHDMGSQASLLLEQCRQEFSRMLQVSRDGIYFTSGGSESNYLAIHALFSAVKNKSHPHIITCIAEHSSVHQALDSLTGCQVTKLPYDKSGRMDLEKLHECIGEQTALIVLQHVNPEIGTIQPIEAVAAICREKGIYLHVDCVQSFTKIPLTAISSVVDSLAISGHKFYGPKGIGVLYLRPEIPYIPYYAQTSHERGMRPGTVNVPCIAAMTVAANKQLTTWRVDQERYQDLRMIFIERLRAHESDITIFGSTEADQQLPAIIGLSLSGLEGQWVMLEANRKGFALSTGSACAVGKQTASKTMTALGITGKQAKEFIRVSFGSSTTEQDCIELADCLRSLIQTDKRNFG